MVNLLRISLATLILIPNPGCSLILTKGPEPEVRPPPECTTSVAAPVADTVLATLSVALLGLGVAGVVASGYGGVAVSCPVSGCNSGVGEVLAISLSAVAVGAATGALFITSAAVGYQRTSACRASLEPKALPALGPVVPATSLFPASPTKACAAVGDAPRVCTNATTWN
jgi:hypothetical protein